jgi:hypothetical protein
MNKALRAYLLYCLIIFITVYVVMLQTWIQSSEQGLAGGVYSVLVRTSVLGENWVELFHLAFSGPRHRTPIPETIRAFGA